MIPSDSGRVAVFGLGFTGLPLAEEFHTRGWEVYGFSRSSSYGQGSPLDASQRRSCQEVFNRLPRFHAVFITFPPGPVHPVFWKLTEKLGDRRFLLGTTGIYERVEEGQRITEQSPLKPDHERLTHEENFLRSEGTVVRLAGIYGPGRHPLRWVRNGRVGYEDRQLNLVHVNDIVEALIQMACRGVTAPIYNLADGQVHRWTEIIDFLLENQWISEKPESRSSSRPDSFIENRLFRSHFPDFRFRDFWDSLRQLAIADSV